MSPVALNHCWLMNGTAMAKSANAITVKRIDSIDLLRGIVMILMVLDHVRDYFHSTAFLYNPTDLTQTNPPLFLTRWITHYCAPVFIFLAGTSAYLYGLKKSRKQLSRFLFTRGLWFLLMEVVFITFGWTFNPFYHMIILQVIWAISVSMIVLSLLVYLPVKIIFYFGIVIVALHNLLDAVVVRQPGVWNTVWSLLHYQNLVPMGSRVIAVAYPVLPWTAVMALGYCLGTLYAPGYEAVKRKKMLIRMGWGAIALFVLIRLTNLYGDPVHWSIQKNAVFTLLSFINVSKYPPSLLYILVTLGPALLFLAYMERPMNALERVISVFGRVPFFFYFMHIYLIHLLAMVAAVATGYKWSDMVLDNWVLFVPQLKGYGFDIIIVYIVVVLVLAILYPLCKRFDRYKRSHSSSRWLSYL